MAGGADRVRQSRAEHGGGSRWGQRTPTVPAEEDEAMNGRTLFVLIGGLLAAGSPGYALPLFARQYGVDCNQCHSIAPRLNPFGLAFQANHYNWPGKKPLPGTSGRKSGLPPLPFSGLATFSGEDNRTVGKSAADFHTLELFVVNGFGVGRQRRGSYFVDALAATREDDGREGDLEKAFVSLPVVGRRGEGALTVGQFTPLTYQWDPNNQLTETLPFALADEVDGFTFTDPVPGVRAEYFNHPGQETADGNYLTVGVPFEGKLALNRHARWGGAHGVFAHGFRRWGYDSVGLFGFTHAGNHLEGVIGTHPLRKNLYLLGVGAVGHDSDGSTRRLAVQGEYVASPRLALTADLEALGGKQNDLGGIAAVTYYPFNLPVLRLTAEMVQRKGDRSLILFARGQF
jgi:hypothetical protein